MNEQSPSTPKTFESTDAWDARGRCEEAALVVRARAEVLTRLFELQEVNAHNTRAGGSCTDFAGEREEAFWLGLRHLVAEIRESADVLARQGKPSSSGGAR